jgi:hypothetical protein
MITMRQSREERVRVREQRGEWFSGHNQFFVFFSALSSLSSFPSLFSSDSMLFHSSISSSSFLALLSFPTRCFWFIAALVKRRMRRKRKGENSGWTTTNADATHTVW